MNVAAFARATLIAPKAVKPAGAERPMTELRLAAPVRDDEIALRSLEIPGCDAATVYARGVLEPVSVSLRHDPAASVQARVCDV